MKQSRLMSLVEAVASRIIRLKGAELSVDETA